MLAPGWPLGAGLLGGDVGLCGVRGLYGVRMGWWVGGWVGYSRCYQISGGGVGDGGGNCGDDGGGNGGDDGGGHSMVVTTMCCMGLVRPPAWHHIT